MSSQDLQKSEVLEIIQNLLERYSKNEDLLAAMRMVGEPLFLFTYNSRVRFELTPEGEFRKEESGGRMIIELKEVAEWYYDFITQSLQGSDTNKATIEQLLVRNVTWQIGDLETYAKDPKYLIRRYQPYIETAER